MSVTTPVGFRAAGVAAGLKSSGDLDLAIVVNDGPQHTAAGVFTTNRVVAAPVVWTRQVVADGRISAVVLNSGGANACTGPEGFTDTHQSAEHAAHVLRDNGHEVSAGDVAVCSTGLIGVRLPMDNVTAGITAATHALDSSGGGDAARAIMTTDTVPKEATEKRDGWSVGGMAKGAGMLAPNLATMLAVVTTDAHISHARATAALQAATHVSFDRADSDGCMSTNDTVLLLASGASKVEPAAGEFEEALTQVCEALARALIADAEGAAHEIAITVEGATSEEAAVAVGREIARSNLVKAAIFGNDPNWGRIISAAGVVPEQVAPFDPARIDVTINGVQVCVAGGPGQSREQVDLTPRHVDITVSLHAGSHAATIWTNDLTHEYVHENSAYST